MVFRVERWRVQPMELPRVWRHCTGCGGQSPFVCSEKFRVNAQKKVIDVWLIYRCAACDATWNLPIVSRCAVTALAAELRTSYEHNDRHTAWQRGFDLCQLRRHCSRIEVGDALEVHRSFVPSANSLGDRIHIEVAYACDWRLDRLLAHQLGLARHRLVQWVETGHLTVSPKLHRPLRRPIQDNMEVQFHGLNVLL